MRKQGEPEVFRITGARTGLTEDVRGRQRRYIISMSVRTVSVVLTVVLWNVERPLAWAMLVLGALLPYVAVVIANGGRENGPPAMPTVAVPPPVRPALEATLVESSAERHAKRDAEHGVPPSAPADDTASAAGSAESTAEDAPTAAADDTEPLADRSDLR